MCAYVCVHWMYGVNIYANRASGLHAKPRAIQLSQLGGDNFGHSDIISSVNSDLINNCVTFFTSVDTRCLQENYTYVYE